MKLGTGIALVIGFSLALAVTSKHAKPEFEWRKIDESNREERKGEERSVAETRPEEREFISQASLDAYTAKNDKSNNYLNAGTTTLNSAAALMKIDPSKSGEDIAWEVANAIVPMIGTALSFIPGVGPIISGVFLGVWSLVSAIFGPKVKQDNPMEKMITELANRIRKEVDIKLGNIINRAIYGEIARNSYICNKYTYVNQSMASKFVNNTPLSKTDANTLMMYVNDCDNFLKDTAEAFVYDEYADVLWIPSAITTMARISFLAELIKSGPLIRLQPKIIAAYFQELKNDTRRQLTFYSKGMDIIQTKLQAGEISYQGGYVVHAPIDYYVTDNLTKIGLAEKAACKLQNQFLYFDHVLYPYGKPTVIDNADMFANITMADYYNDSEFERLKVKHLQIFLNVANEDYDDRLPKRWDNTGDIIYSRGHLLRFLNCLIGPMYLKSARIYWFNFHTLPKEKSYSYEFRLIYLEADVEDPDTKDFTVPILTTVRMKYDIAEYKQVHKNINKEAIKPTRLMIKFNRISNLKGFGLSEDLVDVPVSVRTTECWDGRKYTTCKSTKWYNDHIRKSTFKIRSVGTFNHNSEKLNPLIWIDLPIVYSKLDKKYERYGHIIGLEIILRPYIPMGKK